MCGRLRCAFMSGIFFLNIECVIDRSSRVDRASLFFVHALIPNAFLFIDQASFGYHRSTTSRGNTMERTMPPSRRNVKTGSDQLERTVSSRRSRANETCSAG